MTQRQETPLQQLASALTDEALARRLEMISRVNKADLSRGEKEAYLFEAAKRLRHGRNAER